MKKYVKCAAEPDLSVQDTLDRLAKVRLDVNALETLHWGEDGGEILHSVARELDKVSAELKRALKYFD